jgi:hypothetical protein
LGFEFVNNYHFSCCFFNSISIFLDLFTCIASQTPLQYILSTAGISFVLSFAVGAAIDGVSGLIWFAALHLESLPTFPLALFQPSHGLLLGVVFD